MKLLRGDLEAYFNQWLQNPQNKEQEPPRPPVVEEHHPLLPKPATKLPRSPVVKAHHPLLPNPAPKPIEVKVAVKVVEAQNPKLIFSDSSSADLPMFLENSPNMLIYLMIIIEICL